MRNWKWYSKVLLVLVLAAFAYWVWPTPWAYGTIEAGVLMRRHRISGSIQIRVVPEDKAWRPTGQSY